MRNRYRTGLIAAAFIALVIYTPIGSIMSHPAFVIVGYMVLGLAVIMALYLVKPSKRQLWEALCKVWHDAITLHPTSPALGKGQISPPTTGEQRHDQ